MIEIYLKLLLLGQAYPDSARKLFEAYKDSLPDSLKVKLYSELNWNIDSLLEGIIKNTKDPAVWKYYIYRKFVPVQDWKAFKSFVKKNFKKFSNIPEVLDYVGKVFENAGENKEALKFYKLSADKGYPEAVKDLAVLYARINKCDSAIQLFDKFSIDEIRDSYERRRVLLSMGLCYEKKGNYQRALDLYKEAYTIQKDTTLGFKIAYLLARRDGEEALSFLAGMYEDLGFERPNLYWGYALIMGKNREKIREGIREVSEFLAKNGDDARARNILTHAFLRLGDTLTALKHAKRAFEIENKDDEYRLAYLMILSGIEENPRKFGVLLKEGDKKDPLGKLVFARFYAKSGNKNLAKKLYSELVEIDPKNIPLLLEVYSYSKKVRDLKLAKKTIKTLTENFPDSLNFWFELGDIYLRLMEAESLYVMYKSLLESYSFKLNDCQLAIVLNNWAYTISLLNYKLDTARVLIERSYELCPNEHILDTKGWIYFLMGKREDAKRLIEEAIKIYLDKGRMDPEVILHHALISCALGEDNGRRTLREVWKYIDEDYRKIYRNYKGVCENNFRR
jgi:tetratricopeptide (TPR) repeat protein